jgi:DNA-binding XRE family transcriptional regulator
MRLPRNGTDLYNKVQGPAEAVKGYIQILIGLIVIGVFAYQFYSNRNEHFNIADTALGLVGYGLAVSAAVELAYTFFTKGPDEALDPFILGLASFAIIALGKLDPSKLTTASVVPISLLALAILLLFVARRFLLGPEAEDPDAEHYDVSLALRLGQDVRERRIKLNLSLKELAARARISQRALTEIEAGRIIPTVSVMRLIAIALNAELVVEIWPQEKITAQGKIIAQEKKPRPRWSRL